MGYEQSRMLQIVSIILIMLGILQGLPFLLGVDIYEITPDGIMMIQGFHVVEEIYLLTLVPWATIITQSIAALFGTVTDLTAGIIGVANWRKPERANRCLLWGLIAIVANVMVMLVLEPAAGIGSLVIHVLYMIGAYQIKEV